MTCPTFGRVTESNPAHRDEAASKTRYQACGRIGLAPRPRNSARGSTPLGPCSSMRQRFSGSTSERSTRERPVRMSCPATERAISSSVGARAPWRSTISALDPRR